MGIIVEYYKTIKDVPLSVLRPIVFKVAEETGIKGRDAFCIEQNQCIERVKQELGPGAGHLRSEDIAQHILCLGKAGKIPFGNGNNGSRSYVDVESEADSDCPYSEELKAKLETKESRDAVAAARERDGHRCRLCGAGPDKVLQGHHITHCRVGEPGEVDDLTTLCRKCHFGYHDLKNGKYVRKTNRKASNEQASDVSRDASPLLWT